MVEIQKGGRPEFTDYMSNGYPRGTHGTKEEPHNQGKERGGVTSEWNPGGIGVALQRWPSNPEERRQRELAISGGKLGMTTKTLFTAKRRELAVPHTEDVR